MKCPISRLLLITLLLFSIPAQAQELRIVNTLAANGAITVLEADSANRRLYAGRDGALDIYDLDSGKVLQSLSVPGKIGGIALAPQQGNAWVSLSDSGQIARIDLATLKIERSLRSPGKEPRELIVDAANKRVYVSHAGDGLLWVLDTDTGRSQGTLALGGKLRGLSLDGRGKLFIADEARDVLHVVDTEKFRSVGEIPVWPGRGPTALANDVRERRIYVSTASSHMIVVDPDSGQMLAVINTQGSGSAGIAVEYAPARLVRLYLPNADGRIDVVKNAKLTPSLQTTLAPSGTGTAIAFDSNSKHAFVAAGNSIKVIAQ